jgi:hypothetical protein
MKRYSNDTYDELVESDKGEWVSYNEAQAEIAVLEKKLDAAMRITNTCAHISKFDMPEDFWDKVFAEALA